MAEVVVDSNVIFGFRMQRDQWHDRALDIVHAMDNNDLPQGQITNYALPEILNPIQRRAGDDHAIKTLEFLETSRGFRIRPLSREDLARGRTLFKGNSGVELPDAVTVAYMRRTGIEYIYSFDDDFDRFEGVRRLTTAVDPFAPD